MSQYLLESTKTGNFNPRRTLSVSFFVIPERLASIRAVVLAFTANKQTNKQTLSIIYTSRGSPPSASYHYYGHNINDIPTLAFYDGASTITILVHIIMLGQCLLLVIASDMVNRMPTPGMMECKAFDYTESHSSK